MRPFIRAMEKAQAAGASRAASAAAKGASELAEGLGSKFDALFNKIPRTSSAAGEVADIAHVAPSSAGVSTGASQATAGTSGGTIWSPHNRTAGPTASAEELLAHERKVGMENAKIGVTKMGPAAEGQEGLGMFGVFSHAMKEQPFTKSMLGGAAIFGGAATAGSFIYGGVKAVTPNNATVNDPIKNIAKGIGFGVAAGALVAASHGMAAEGLTKIADKGVISKLTNVQHSAGMVEKTMKSALFGGALAAATVAGSGDVNFTKPLNPVY